MSVAALVCFVLAAISRYPWPAVWYFVAGLICWRLDHWRRA